MSKENCVDKNYKHVQRRLTFAISLLTFHAHHLWCFVFLIISANHREGTWYYWRISTATFIEVSIWHANPLIAAFLLIAIGTSIILSVCYIVCYVNSRKGKSVSLIPFYFGFVLQIGALITVVFARLFTIFGLYWIIINTAIIVLIFFIIRMYKKSHARISEGNS